MNKFDMVAASIVIFGVGVITGISLVGLARPKSTPTPTLEQRVRELDARVRVLEGESKSTNFYMPVGRRIYGTKQTT
jgi:hypothetical protein